MKGPIHKFAQIMLNVFSLPPEAEENFKSVLWSRQLVAEKAMRKVFEDDLGRKIDDVFSEFDFTPIGIGSVSQVYRARLKSGEEVAVKIQYPDLEKITKQDIAMFFRIFTAARWLLPSVDVAAVKKHVQRLVESEIDFRDEARISLELQKIAASGARWSVPMVYQHLSTRRVLTTEYINGQNIYQFSETSTEAERLSAAQAVSEFAIRSVLDAGLVCIDPHPANMIFSKGKVYLIDFGFFMKVSPDFVNVHREILLSHTATGDARVDRYQMVLHRAGLLRSSPQIADSDVRDFLNVMSRQFNWQTCADPNLQDRFNELFFKKGINKIFGADDPEFFLSYLGQRQVYKTISRFNVPQPHEWTFILAGELGLESAGSRAG
jgi:predicted unusual protein kinase regulating ubiquinone biosynthesis (AarF/ABC1/UbiB family)